MSETEVKNVEVEEVEEIDISKLVNDYAIENFKTGLNCCESVYEALQRVGVMEDMAKEALALAVGFGGGIGASGLGPCGALAAAVMANGAVHGRKDPKAIDASVRMKEIGEKYYPRYNNMIFEFVERNGGTSCAEICSKYEDFHGRDRKVNCMKLIGATASLAYKYIQLSNDETAEMGYVKKNGDK